MLLEHWPAHFSVQLMLPETSSGASTEQLTSCVDLSLSFCWSAHFCMLAQNKICSASKLLSLCFDCVLEPSVSNYHSCELSSECCCCLQCSSELSQKNIQDFLLSVFKGFYSVKDLVNVTNSTWRWHTSFCIEKRNFLPETFVGNCAGLSCKVIDRTVLSWKVIDHAVLSWKVIDCVPCYVGR